jgi:hypothetical protein
MPASTTRNECGVVTIYPMTVTCNPTNPTSEVASNGSVSLTIYGGSPPYSIEWTNGSYEQSLYNLSVGSYTATVTDFNEDYTQVITCTLTPPMPATTISPEPTTTQLPEYNICFTKNEVGVNYIANGFYNGKNTWTSEFEDSRIFWDTSLNPDSWRLTGSGITELIINSNPAYPPINGWQMIGGLGVVSAVIGECTPSNELDFTLTKENPSCTCDGVITVNATGGAGGYQYSFLNTYQLLPFKNGLCGGNYTVTVKDSEGNTKTKSILLNTIQPAVNYNISSSTQLYQQLTPSSKEYRSTISFTTSQLSSVPAGVQVTTNIVVNWNFTRGPLATSATANCSVELVKNGTTISVGTINTTETTGVNTSPGSCNGNTNYITNYTSIFSNVVISSTDVVYVKINQTKNVNCAQACCVSEFSLPSTGFNNVVISGCDCCNITTTPSLES